MEKTKKAPGRPAQNCQPRSCSGQPLSREELLHREHVHEERKLIRQLEKKRQKMAAKGIHVDVDTLKRRLQDHGEDDEDGEEQYAEKECAATISFSIDNLLNSSKRC